MLNWNDIEQMLISGNLCQEKLYLEYKEAKNDVPKAVWESYSAFANQSGGLYFARGCRKTKSAYFRRG
ncbi:hypothetical protein [Histophilus somni]|uniref:hypothetical protein n=1 Tax=Histophilus somni TaxID=731 RepID=UPI000039715E|nr:hypothetical protein [Histophilus somni]ACA32134.1 hypothetical protein HSM_0487 [Histophilus somni 2336]